MADILQISLCMIVKNEEVFLDNALKSVKKVLGLDDIVVIDTGSTDKTKEIALNNGSNIFDFKWIDDFSAARNYSVNNAKNDWILFIDADEEIKKADIDNVKEFLSDTQAVGLISLLDLNNKKVSKLARLFNRTTHTFEGSIHEQLKPTDGRIELILKDVSISMDHHGYLPEFDKVNAKLERNERLLLKELKKKPKSPYLLYQLGKSYFCNDRDLQKANEYFEKALKAGADASISYTYDLVECYGYALLDTGQYEKALALKERYSLHYNKNAPFRFLTAHIYQNNGMFIEAVESYESCISADIYDSSGINSFLSYYNIGVILECVGMLEEAVEMYRNCGDYEPAKQRLKEL